MTSDFIADISRELAGLRMLPSRVDIRVGSAQLLLQAIEKRVGLVKDVLEGKANTFCGVPVIEDKRLPNNVAVILQDGEIIQVVAFA